MLVCLTVSTTSGPENKHKNNRKATRPAETSPQTAKQHIETSPQTAKQHTSNRNATRPGETSPHSAKQHKNNRKVTRPAETSPQTAKQHICRSGLIFAGLGLYLQVWAYSHAPLVTRARTPVIFPTPPTPCPHQPSTLPRKSGHCQN